MWNIKWHEKPALNIEIIVCINGKFDSPNCNEFRFILMKYITQHIQKQCPNQLF